jgi:hypothetical protein
MEGADISIHDGIDCHVIVDRILDRYHTGKAHAVVR